MGLLAYGVGRIAYRAYSLSFTGGHAVQPPSFNFDPSTPAIGFQAKMDIDEARRILELSDDARRAEIVKVHKTLLMPKHPDRGGSNNLTMKINEAKTLLTEKKSRARTGLRPRARAPRSRAP